jgi:hypothetical protein
MSTLRNTIKTLINSSERPSLSYPWARISSLIQLWCRSWSFTISLSHFSGWHSHLLVSWKYSSLEGLAVLFNNSKQNQLFKWAIFHTCAHNLFLYILQLCGRCQMRGRIDNLCPVVVELVLFFFSLAHYTLSSRAPLTSVHSISGIDWASYLIPNVDLNNSFRCPSCIILQKHNLWCIVVSGLHSNYKRTT